MLRQIIELRGKLTRSTDVKVRQAQWKQLNAALKDARKSHLPCIREEVRELTEDSLAVMSIAALDDSLIIPVILLVLSDLKSAHEAKLSNLLQTLLGKDLVKECKAKSAIDLLFALLPTQPVRLFEQHLNEKTCDQISAESVRELISATTATLCNALAGKAKIDLSTLSAEFTSCVSNELIRACIHEIFQVTDNQQTASIFSTLFSSITLSHDKIIKPYMALPFCVASLTLDQATQPYWSELALWFEGLHYHHFKLLRATLQADVQPHRVDHGLIIMTDDKPYPPVNPIDAGMFQLYGLTLYDLARHVYAAHGELIKHLPAPDTVDNEIIVTVRAHGIFASHQAASSAVAVLESNDPRESQSMPNLNNNKPCN